MRLAIFDLDGTVLRGNSWHTYFWWAVQRWPSHAPGLLAKLALRRASLMSARALRETALRPLLGSSLADVTAVGHALVEKKILEKVRPMARAEIARCVAEGLEPVLATGAFDFLAEPLAKALQIREIVCSRLEFSEGVCRGRIAGEETRGPVKAAAVRALFAGRDINWEKSRAFSDDGEDSPLWALVGEPVLVVRTGAPRGDRPPGVKVVEWTDR